MRLTVLFLLAFGFSSFSMFKGRSKESIARLQVKKPNDFGLNWKLEEEAYYNVANGDEGMFLIELKQFEMGHDWRKMVSIRLFRYSYYETELLQRILIPKDGTIGLHPLLDDYNNDDYLDLKVKTGEAMRGSNDVSSIFLYNPSGDSLVYLKNSENYPNLRYNEKLDCIDAWAIYGGSCTTFLKVQGDSLVERASIEVNDGELTMWLFKSNGDLKRIERKPTGLHYLTRFNNYRPIEYSYSFGLTTL